MKGKIIYISIAAALGISASASSLQAQLFLLFLLLVFFYWVFRYGDTKLLISCYVAFVSFAIYFFAYDSLNSSKLSSGMANVAAEIVSIPRMDDDRLSFRVILASNEQLQLSYRLQSMDEKKQMTALEVGMVCRFQGKLTEPNKARNFFAFDYHAYLYRNRIHWLFSASEIAIETCQKTPATPVSQLHNWRKASLLLIDQNFPSPAKGIVQALVFGERILIPEATIDLYQKMGIIHLLAISGLHVGLISTAIFYFLTRIGITREHTYITLLVFLPLYMILAGGAPSVVRACLMVIVFLLTRLIKHHLTSTDGISLAAVIMLLYRPYLLFEPGFQLSFIVSLSLLLSPAIFDSNSSFLKRLLMSSFIAYVSSFPIIIFHFFETSFMSILVNLLYIPYVSFVVLPSSFIAFLITVLFPDFLAPAIFLNEMLIFSEVALKKLEPFIVTIGFQKPDLWLVFLYFCSITVLFFALEHGRKTASAVLGLILVICLHASLAYLNPKGEVTMIDVGQGESIYIELPFRRAVYLIDTGGSFSFTDGKGEDNSQFEVGRDIVVPFLKAKGVRKIDKLILTHGDVDHVGGAKAVLKEIAVREVILGRKRVWSEMEQQIAAVALSQKSKISVVERGDHWTEGPYSFYVLSPNGDENSENNSSIMIYTKLGPWTWLFTGDVEKEGEQSVLNTYKNIRADVLKVGHHGSLTSSSQSFVEKIRPSIALVSAGVNNRFGHPHPNVVEILEGNGIHLYRTDEQGSIQYVFSKNKGTFRTKLP